MNKQEELVPLSFDPKTSRKMLGDERARELESIARADADAFREPRALETAGGTYFECCVEEFASAVYREAYGKRMARMMRKGLPAGFTPESILLGLTPKDYL